MQTIYLDHNSTTPIAPQVVAAMTECYTTSYLNPASQHELGRAARRRLEAARERIAELLGAQTTGMGADTVIFTSGGTEANNLAMFGLSGLKPGVLFISRIEHPSIVGPAEELQRRGWKLLRVKVTPDGVIDIDHVQELIESCEASSGVISVMLGNNETGVRQPVHEIATLAHKCKLLIHTDAVQVTGKLPTNFRDLNVDALTVTAHKFHGPRGIGALILRHGVDLQPLLHGGFQQAGLRPGTEDVSLAVGMQTALELWRTEAAERLARMTTLRDSFEQRLAAADPSIVINGQHAPRLPHTSNISFPGIDRQALLMALDLAGVACSTGSACASGSSEPSPVLVAMGCDEAVISGSLRFSLGATTTAEEIDEAVRRISCAANDLRRQK